MVYVIRQFGMTAWARTKTAKEARTQYTHAQSHGLDVHIFREMIDGRIYEVCPDCFDEFRIRPENLIKIEELAKEILEDMLEDLRKAKTIHDHDLWKVTVKEVEE